MLNLDSSKNLMETMEEGDISGIKLTIRRKSIDEDIVNKEIISKQIENIFGGMANNITNQREKDAINNRRCYYKCKIKCYKFFAKNGF
jgi:hypothetical protein